MQRPPPKYSIVIPAYNEAARLPRALEKIRAYLLARDFDAEVLVVDDGSTDATAEIAREADLHWPDALRGVRLVSNGENRGKGYSVRHGMLEAQRRRSRFLPMPIFLRRSRNSISCLRLWLMPMWLLGRGLWTGG